MLFKNKFILASSSKSRYKILKQNNLLFSKIKPRCNEGLVKTKMLKNNFSPKKISLELARLKSLSVGKKNKDQLVVGSDTVIFFEGFLLNKAKNKKDAKKKLKLISGSILDVYSSASVFCGLAEVWKTSQKSKVKIRNLNDKEIEYYLSKAGKDILTSVGCFQVEKLGPNIIEYIKGDFFNVMGFPLFPFLLFLKKYKKKK